MISLSAATGLLEAMAAAGANVDRVLRLLGLERKVLMNPHGFMPDANFAQLLEEAATATGDDCFGLHFGEHYQPKNIGALVYVVVNSPTIEMALENVARYLRVHNQAAEVSVVKEPTRVVLHHRLVGVPADGRRQHDEYSLAVGLNTVRLMAGSTWGPMEVQFGHKAPQQISEHLRIFGAPVLFDCPANALVVDREFLERSVPAADNRLYPILRHYLDHVLEDMPAGDDLIASVQRAIAESMRHGDPGLTQVARALAVGPRSLQRQLREYGTDFKGLLDDTRRHFALRYLQDRRNTLTEVAYLLGYSEVSAFNRAFKRWTGSTPSAHRRALLYRARHGRRDDQDEHTTHPVDKATAGPRRDRRTSSGPRSPGSDLAAGQDGERHRRHPGIGRAG